MAYLNDNNTVLDKTITLEKQSNTKLTLQTNNSYVGKNIELILNVKGGSATTPTTTITANPTISVDSNGLVTASYSGNKTITPTVSAGYVSTGTAGTVSTSGSNTKQLTTLGTTTYNTSTSDQTISSGKYITGTQTIRKVTTNNISAGNIKDGITVEVGDVGDSDRIIGVVGTFTDSSTVSSGQTAATAGKILSGYSAWVDGEEVKGNIATKTSANMTVNGKTVTAPAGYYASNQSKSVAVGTITSGSATISDASYTYNSDNDNFDVTGSATIAAPSINTAGYVSNSEGTKNTNIATLATTVPKISGSVEITGASTKQPSISRQTFTISGVTDASNGDATTTAPASGVYVKVKSAANTGTLTATPSISTNGYGTDTNHGITNGSTTVGASASADTYIPIKTGSARTPATTITSTPSISVSNTGLITSSNSKTQNVTPSVSAGYVSSGTAGTITVNGSNTLQLTTQAEQTITPTTSNQTIASGTYLTGTQTIAGDADLVAGNIKKGVEIFGVTGTFTTTPSGKTALAASALRSGYAGFINGNQVNGSMPDASFANTASSGVTYTDKSSNAPVLVSGDYLYVNKGYTDNIKISLAKLVPDGSDVKGHGEYLLSGHSAYDNDGTLIAGTIPTLDSTDVSISGKTITIPVGKYTGESDATAISVNIDEGAVTTSFSNDGMSTYFDSGTSSNKNVTITPKYTNTAGYIAAHSSATNNGGTAYYKIKNVSGSIGGSASNGSATAAIANTNSIATITDLTNKTAGTDYWQIKATATGTAGSYTPKYTVSTAGWIASNVNGTAQTVSVSSDSTGQSLYIPKATLGGSSTNATATTTVAPGTVSISKQNVPSGVTQAASGNATTTAPSSGVYVAVKATAAANTTGTTSSISGSGSATVTSAGYAPSSLTGNISVSGTATAKTSAKDSSVTYVPITTATPAFDGGDLTTSSDTNTVTAPTVTISSTGTFKTTSGYGVTTTKPSGTDGTNYLTIDGSGANSNGKAVSSWGVSRAAVLYNGAVNGWVSKSDNAQALANGSTSGGKETAITATITDNFAPLYIPIVSNSFSGGGISITNNYSKNDLAVTMASGSDTNMANITVGSKDTTNYPYYFKVNGSTPAVSGKTKATRAQATYTNNAGAITAHSGTEIWASSYVEPTVSVNAASGSTYVGLKKATMTVAGTNTVTPSASIAGSNVTLSTTNNGIQVTATGGGTASVTATATTNAAGYAPASTQLGSATLNASNKTTTTSKYISGVKIPIPASGTNNFTIDVPNGNSEWITLTISVDTSGNWEIN